MAHPLTKVTNFTYNTLNKQLDPSKEFRKTTEPILLAYNGDFWQDGKGSLLPAAAGEQASVLTNAMERHFIFRNVIREVVECVSRAFFGKSPNWSIAYQAQPITTDEAPATDTAEQPAGPGTPEGVNAGPVGTEQLNAIEKALGEFWTSQDASSVMSEAFQTRLVGGRGGIRVYIPVKYHLETQQARRPSEQPKIDGVTQGTPADVQPIEVPRQTIEFNDILEGIAAMRAEFIPPDRAKLLTDDGDLFSIVKYQRVNDWENNITEAVIEFSFVDDESATFIGLVPERSDKSRLEDSDLSDPLGLNGWTTYNEFVGEPYVTNALYKNNQLLNLALSCSSFSLVDNGFGEVFFTNAELEFETFIGPDGSTQKRPKRMVRGGGAIQNIVGITSQNSETGQETTESPGIHFKEPTALTAFKDGKELAYRACLEEAGQLYRLISGDATPSGESRIQAMADFVIKILKYKSEVDKMGSWLLTTVLKWAAQVSGEAEQLKDYSIIFDSKVFVAQVSADEKTAIMEQRDKGIISMETARVLLGVEDPILEEELVAAEQSESILTANTDDATKRVAVAIQMMGILPQSAIMRFLGFSDADVVKLKKELADEQATQLEQFTNPGGANPDNPNPPQPGQPIDGGAQ